MPSLNEVQRQIDQEIDEMPQSIWQEEERVVWCPVTGYSVVEMTHRVNHKLEAELVRLGKLHND